MPYEGQIISVPEMLDALVASGRTDHQAAAELARALEERAIVLAYRNGHVLTIDDLAPVIDLIMAFPGRLRSAATDETALRLSNGGAGAWRIQFEKVCGLMQGAEQSPKEQGLRTREEAVKQCLDEGLRPANTVSWTVFCDRVRDLADGWVDKKQGTLKRGFDEKTIKRDVKKLIN